MPRFRPGESGNTDGPRVRRPVGIWLDRLLKDDEALGARELARALYEAARGAKPLKKGQLLALQELLDRVEGRPAQQIRHTGDVGSGLLVTLTSAAVPADLAAQAERARAASAADEGRPAPGMNGHARSGSKF